MAIDTSTELVDPNISIDDYVNQYFQEYFGQKHVVNQNDFELVKSFFQARTDNPTDPSVAANTVAVLLAADQLKVYPSDIIQRIDTADYKKTFSLILNLTRQGVSLIGYEQLRTTSIENSRQVVA
jgi:hypothetical protein|tara:strand:- start:222 stop:596 length:375 start_codon:yes stop_codon:yes gene_type:complete